MQDHELDTIAQVFEKLSSDVPLDDKTRAYLVGKLEQLLAPYKVDPKPKRNLMDLFKP